MLFEISYGLCEYIRHEGGVDELQEHLDCFDLLLNLKIVICILHGAIEAEPQTAHYHLHSRKSYQPAFQKPVRLHLCLENDRPANCVDTNSDVEKYYTSLPYCLAIAL